MSQALPPDFWEDAESTPDRPQVARRGRGCAGRFVRGVFLLFLLVVLVYLAVDYVLHRTWEGLRREQLAVQSAELPAAPVDPQENAVTYYVEAAARMKEGLHGMQARRTAGEIMAPLWEGGIFGVAGSLSPEQLEELRRVVDANEAVWPMILKAFNQPYFRTSLGAWPPEEGLQEIEAIREVTDHVLASAYLRGLAAEGGAACDALMVALHMGTQLWQEDLLLSGMLGYSVTAMVFSTARAIEAQTALPEACMETFILASRSFRDGRRAVAQLAGEREFSRRRLEVQEEPSTASWKHRLERPLRILLALQVEAQYAQALEALGAPEQEQREVVMARRLPLAFLPGCLDLHPHLRQFGRQRVTFGLAEMMFQAMRYRQRHGRYPESLDALGQAGIQLPEDILNLEVEFRLREHGLELAYVGPVELGGSGTVMIRDE